MIGRLRPSAQCSDVCAVIRRVVARLFQATRREPELCGTGTEAHLSQAKQVDRPARIRIE